MSAASNAASNAGAAVAAIDRVVIGFGGNVGGEPAVIERFRRAREGLGAVGAVRAAPLYRTAPLGPPQAAFLNTAVSLGAADLRPDELLATLHELEHLLGRDRSTESRWGPRTIDLDVLVWGSRVLRSPELEVPHPRLAERRFALAPLAALVGEGFEVPGAGALGPLLARVRTQDLEEIAASW